MKYLFPIVLLFLASACNNATTSGDQSSDIDVSVIQNPVTLKSGSDSNAMPKMQFEEPYHTFGQLVQGEVVKHQFKFTNTGNAPLVISDARASCGCTVPKWPTHAIAPGASDFIEIKFDSKGKQGAFRKTVSIMANTHPNKNEIQIFGNIVKE